MSKVRMLPILFAVVVFVGISSASGPLEIIGHTPTSPGGPATNHYYFLNSVVNVSETVLGGSGNYIYNWTVYSGSCPNVASFPANTFSTSTFDSWHYVVNSLTGNCILLGAVSDASNSSDKPQSEPTGIIHVMPAFSAQTSPSIATAISISENIPVSVYATGATGNYTYSWSVSSGTSCPGFYSNAVGSSNTFIYSPNSVTNKCVFQVSINSIANEGNTIYSQTNYTATINVVNALNPVISFSSPITPSSSAGCSKVSVTGSGFDGSSAITFGYGHSTAMSNQIMINTVSNSSGSWSSNFCAPWETGTFQMYAEDPQNTLANANMMVGATKGSSPMVTLSNSVQPSSNAEPSTVKVTGTGFAANAHVQFGYSPIPPYSNVVIDVTTNATGGWSGNFSAPWSNGTYKMTAQDANGDSVTVNMIVESALQKGSNPVIILPKDVQPSNSTKTDLVKVIGTGFAPNVHIQFGYSPIPPYSNVVVDATSNSTGGWSGSFAAPWSANTNFTMIATDANGDHASNQLTVT